MLPNVDPTATILPSGWRTVAAAVPEPKPKSVDCLPSPEKVGSRPPAAALAEAERTALTRRAATSAVPIPARLRPSAGVRLVPSLPPSRRRILLLSPSLGNTPNLPPAPGSGQPRHPPRAAPCQAAHGP